MTRAVELARHLDDAAAAHAASAISVADAALYITGTDVETAIQEAFSRIDTPLWFRGQVASSGTPVVVGTVVGTEGGTVDTPAKLTGQSTMRSYINKRRSTASTTSASVAFGIRNSTAALEMYATATAASAAGFKLHVRVGVPTIRSDCRFFVGVQPDTTAISGSVDISTLINILGIGKDAGDSQWQFMHNDGSGTASKVALGADFAVVAATTYDLFLWVPKGGGSCLYKVVDLDSGNSVSGSVATNLPANDVALYWQLFGSNGPTGGTACAIEYGHVLWQYPLVGY